MAAFCPQPKPEPRAFTKGRKRRAAGKALDEAYEIVNARDASYCWVTGRYTQPGHIVAGCRRDHHHLFGRNVRPEFVNDPDRIITVTAEAHQLITDGFIVVEGDDARKTIRFHWASHVRPDQRIFVIKSRRWSQNDE